MPTEAYVVAALELFALAKKEGWLAKLRHGLKERHHILLLGVSGVGKSNMMDAMTEPMPDAIDAINRTAFAVKHKLIISNKRFIFIDTPGEDGHFSLVDQELRKVVRRRKPTIIMSVVADGYHEIPIPPDHACDGDLPKPDFLAGHRQLEIEYVERWSRRLTPSDVASIITVISKADLWWHQKETVRRRYSDTNYRDAFGDLGRVNHSRVEFASTVHDFYGRVKAGLDDEIRKKMRKQLFQRLLGAVAEK